MFRASEIAALLVTIMIYAAHFLFWEPQARDNFFSKHVPMVLRWYESSNCSRETVIWLKTISGGLVAPLLTTVASLLFMRRHKLVLPLVGWIWFSYGAFVYQGKGWTYQAIPMQTGIFLSWGLLLVIVLEIVLKRSKSVGTVDVGPGRAHVRLQVLALGLLLLCCVLAGTGICPKRWAALPPDMVSVDAWFSKLTVPGDAVAVIGVDGRRIEPQLLNHRLRWGWRYSFGYLVVLLNYKKSVLGAAGAEQSAKENSQLLGTVVEDISERTPKLILLDDYFRQQLTEHALFEHCFASYKLIDRVDLQGTIYDIYARSAPSGRLNFERTGGIDCQSGKAMY